MASFLDIQELAARGVEMTAGNDREKRSEAVIVLEKHEVFDLEPW